MKIKWQWFTGGQNMFWFIIILFILSIIGFTAMYIVDPVATICMGPESVDPTVIQQISEKYVKDKGIEIDYPIVYRFVKYKIKKQDQQLLGTFHEWNGVYYIDISVDLNTPDTEMTLMYTVIHETRHMIVEYLRDEKVINLTKYTEEIAEADKFYYNSLFDAGVYLLKMKQTAKG